MPGSGPGVHSYRDGQIEWACTYTAPGFHMRSPTAPKCHFRDACIQAGPIHCTEAAQQPRPRTRPAGSLLPGLPRRWPSRPTCASRFMRRASHCCRRQLMLLSMAIPASQSCPKHKLAQVNGEREACTLCLPSRRRSNQSALSLTRTYARTYLAIWLSGACLVVFWSPRSP